MNTLMQIAIADETWSLEESEDALFLHYGDDHPRTVVPITRYVLERMAESVKDRSFA